MDNLADFNKEKNTFFYAVILRAANKKEVLTDKTSKDINAGNDKKNCPWSTYFIGIT